jgi:hypothetical protein
VSAEPEAERRYLSCATCGELKAEEFASQKYGWEEYDTSLPAAVGSLILVADLKPGGSRALQLLACPACGTYYLYRSDYEYLAGGSEDEQSLSRLTDEAAAAYLEGYAPE